VSTTAVLRYGGAQIRRACSHGGRVHRGQRFCQPGGAERLPVEWGGPSAKCVYPPAPEGLVTEERDDLRGQPGTKARRGRSCSTVMDGRTSPWQQPIVRRAGQEVRAGACIRFSDR